ncbi:MAG: hypothetical protein K2P38_11500 [Lachnospiraceae bacterium]|nr:hypothetical protein [Lachnospiraceae bacterium]
MKNKMGFKKNQLNIPAMPVALAWAVLLILELAVLFYYGNQKAGFHEDELYTYYSSNKTAGLFVNDRQWMERDELRNDFVVLPGEGFRYDVVWQMQSWDVHPPLYYFLFHTVCSLFPGVFSKWLGIGLNLLFFAGSFMLLAYCAYMAVVCGKKEALPEGVWGRIVPGDGTAGQGCWHFSPVFFGDFRRRWSPA